MLHSALRKSRPRACSRGLTQAPATVSPATTAQRTPRTHARSFHHTPPRRLFDTPEQIVSAGIGIAAGWVVARFLPSLLGPRIQTKIPIVPPLSWATTVEPGEAASVMSAIGAGYKMARRRPKTLREEAMRDATFALPHEIARFDKDADLFDVEDMGPCTVPPDELQHISAAMNGFKPDFDLQRETRFYTYKRNGSDKAAAAFLVFNAPLGVSDAQSGDAPSPVANGMAYGQRSAVKNGELMPFAINLWVAQFKQWKIDMPNFVEHGIEPGPLPVIFCFQHKTCGSVFNQEHGLFPDPRTTAYVLELVEPDAPVAAA